MKKYIEIKADTNDGDYIVERSKIIDSEIEEILPVINAIKEFNKIHSRGSEEYNWNTIEGSRYKSPYETYKNILTKDQINLFQDYCPNGEYGIHTIESITILHVTQEDKLL